MKNPDKNFDVPFIIFIACIILSLIVTTIVSYYNTKPSNDNIASPSAEPPLASSYPTTPPDEETNAKELPYSLPRTAEVSLSPNIAWELSIGGSGSDTLTEVISLDNFYLFGTTNSSDYDFSSVTDSDLFYACLSGGGELLNTETFGSDKEETLLACKPCGKSAEYNQNVFLAVVACLEDKNGLTVYRIGVDGKNPSSAFVKFNGEVEFVKTVADKDGIITLVNVNEGDKVQAYLFKISANLNEEYKIPLGENRSGKDLLNSVGRCVVLAENSVGGKAIEIIDVKIKDNDYELSRFLLTDAERTGIEIIPDENGYVIPYFFIKSAEKFWGVVHVSLNFRIDFDHIISGSNYESVTVIPDMGAAKLKGYHIYATSLTRSGYATNYENICTHGDLSDYGISALTEVSITRYISNGEYLVVVGNKIKENKNVFYLGVFNKNMSLVNSYEFGGSGNDYLVQGVNSINGDLILFGNTSSSNGDVSRLFGKTDVWVMCFEN